jgi:hypothetical protein
MWSHVFAMEWAMRVECARVSTGDLTTDLQTDSMTSAGWERIFQETPSGAHRDRPELMKALEFLRVGDVHVVWMLERLARSPKRIVRKSDQNSEELEGCWRPQFARDRQAVWCVASDVVSASGQVIQTLPGTINQATRQIDKSVRSSRQKPIQPPGWEPNRRQHAGFKAAGIYTDAPIANPWRVGWRVPMHNSIWLNPFSIYVEKKRTITWPQQVSGIMIIQSLLHHDPSVHEHQLMPLINICGITTQQHVFEKTDMGHGNAVDHVTPHIRVHLFDRIENLMIRVLSDIW